MKHRGKLTAIVLALLLCVTAGACAETETETSSPSEPVSSEEASSTVIEPSSEDDLSEESEESSIIEESSEEVIVKKIPIPEGVKVITNVDYSNNGKKMGDNDGPAYCVYSKTGYNKASMDIRISDIKINNIRESDGKFVNAYMFLGCDVYSGNYWVNCFDTGFCYSGKNPAWHLFFNIYQATGETVNTWYESKVRLDPTHDYRLILDTSESDTKATVEIYDLTDEKTADSATFYVKDMKCNGSNTSYLMDFALDYPQNVKKDTTGTDSEDFVQITLYNTDEDLYMQNVNVENVKLYNNSGEHDWTADRTNNRSLWPDVAITDIDYPCTKVIADEENYDFAYRVDLDMNRQD